MNDLLVVVVKDDGGIELYPMKEWLHRHREHLPQGLDPASNTSHQLRDDLLRSGWSVQETPGEVRLLPEIPREVHGIIVAREVGDGIRYAAK